MTGCEGVCSASQDSREQTESLEDRLSLTAVSDTSNTSNTSNSVLPGFGSAEFFSPLPSDGTVVASLCNWQLRYNFVENRIPRMFLHVVTQSVNTKTFPTSESITEIICTNPGYSCGNSRYFSCRQVKSKMQVYIMTG